MKKIRNMATLFVGLITTALIQYRVTRVHHIANSPIKKFAAHISLLPVHIQVKWYT